MTLKKLLENGGLIGDATVIKIFEEDPNDHKYIRYITEGKRFEDNILAHSDYEIFQFAWTPKELLVYIITD